MTDPDVYEIPPQQMSDAQARELEAAMISEEATFNPPPMTTCDFCGVAPPSWVYPARAMGVLAVTSDAETVELLPAVPEDPDWAACAICAVGIEANDLNQIADRTRRLGPVYQQTRRIAGERVAEEAVIGPAVAMWKAFMHSRTGPRRHV